MDSIWRAGWLFAGHSCQIPNPGDYFLYEVDGDFAHHRARQERQVHALYNVCRHRGSLICEAPEGHVKRFICPYHQWTYDIDGHLLLWRGMQEGLDKSELGLAPRPRARGGGLDLHQPGRGAAGLRAGLRDDCAGHPTPGARACQGCQDHGLRRPLQLEAGLGEQPRVLPLQRQPSAVHQGQLRPLQRRRYHRARRRRSWRP